jgi:hypothetical protein
MRRLLAVLCGLLVAIVGGELAFGSAGGVPTDREATGSQRPARQGQGIAGGATGDAVDHWVDVVLARPLFAPDRKPVGSLVTADAGLPRLTGIIATSDEAIAIFQPAGGGKSMVARHGETVGGWQITTISADGVGLTKSNNRVEIRPRFNDAGVGLAAPAAAPKVMAGKPSPSRWETPADTGMLRARWSNPQLQP